VTFWEHLFRLLFRRPMAAFAALYWYLTRRKVRARNRVRVASADLDYPYAMWIRKHERNDERVDEFQAAIESWARKPRIAVLLHSSGSPTQSELAGARERRISRSNVRSPTLAPLIENSRQRGGS